MDSFALRPNPFAARDHVAVAHGSDPYGNARKVLTSFDLSPARGLRVLIKPNAGRLAHPGQGITTDPRVVAAALDAFMDAGASVVVGESPITGVSTPEAFGATGIADVARERDVPLIDMDARPGIDIAIPGGIAITTTRMCAELRDVDLVVSIPVMKAHMHTGVTLAIKNMKGCLWRRAKVELHMLPPVPGHDDKSLNIAIADMATVLLPHFALIDGTVGMEGLGPSAGEPRQLDVVVGGPDPFAADAVACALMGRDAHQIPHLRLGADRKLGCIELDRLRVTPNDWSSFAVNFAAAPENLSIEFPGVNIFDENSCSACQSTLLLFLQRYATELGDYFPTGEPINIAIGKGHKELPQGTLCIGNCTVCHRDSGIFVAGCPPVGSSIMKTIRKHRGAEEGS